VAAHLAPALPPGALWAQNPKLYHSTLWHASRHTVGVRPTLLRVIRPGTSGNPVPMQSRPRLRAPLHYTRSALTSISILKLRK